MFLGNVRKPDRTPEDWSQEHATSKLEFAQAIVDHYPKEAYMLAKAAYQLAEKPSDTAVLAATLVAQVIRRTGIEPQHANRWEMDAAAALPDEAFHSIPPILIRRGSDALAPPAQH